LFGRLAADTSRQNRRSFYSLKKSSAVPDAKIQEIVERAVKHAPNAFNAQQSRAVIVTGAQHDQLWEFIEASYNKLFEGNSKCFLLDVRGAESLS
jgi:uncharacterized protein